MARYLGDRETSRRRLTGQSMGTHVRHMHVGDVECFIDNAHCTFDFTLCACNMADSMHSPTLYSHTPCISLLATSYPWTQPWKDEGANACAHEWRHVESNRGNTTECLMRHMMPCYITLTQTLLPYGIPRAWNWRIVMPFKSQLYTIAIDHVPLILLLQQPTILARIQYLLDVPL